jgi:hypothetical protein
MQTQKHNKQNSIFHDQIIKLALQYAVGSEKPQIKNGNPHVICQVLKRTSLYHGGVR